jgi:hypothetical protein
MRRLSLGEFEEIVLLITASLEGDAYGVTITQEIEKQTGRTVGFNTVHNPSTPGRKRVHYFQDGRCNSRTRRTKKEIFQYHRSGRKGITANQRDAGETMEDRSFKNAGIIRKLNKDYLHVRNS